MEPDACDSVEFDNAFRDLLCVSPTNVTVSSIASCLTSFCLTSTSPGVNDSGSGSAFRTGGGIPSTANNDVLLDVAQRPTAAEVWGYGFAVVTGVNICSLFGAVVIPFSKYRIYHDILIFLISLAVGTLCASSLLFLIPDALQLGEFVEMKQYPYRMTTVIGGIYLFFVLERGLKFLAHFCVSKPDGQSSSSATEQGDGDRVQIVPSASTCESRTRALSARQRTTSAGSCGSSGLHDHDPITCVCALHCPPKNAFWIGRWTTHHVPENHVMHLDMVATENIACAGGVCEDGCTVPLAWDKSALPTALRPAAAKGRFNDIDDIARAEAIDEAAKALPPSSVRATKHTPMREVNSFLFSYYKIAPVAWMIIGADGLHNFIDGLSIGAAFTQSILAGVSVSVAVLCEELPHELGDFAVLLQSGMSVKQALCSNFLSACFCYIGLVLGILLGGFESAVHWIFAIAGGMFLYISLVDMLPEVNHAAEEPENLTSFRKALGVFAIQNIGLLTGYGVIFLMSVYGGQLDFTSS